MSKAVQNTVNVNAGGDKVNQGIGKIIAELALIYGHINSLFGLQAGPTQPGDRNVNDVWLDTSGTTPILKRWDGGAWQALGASGNYASGVTLDNATRGVSSGMLLSRSSASSLLLAASSAAPATLGIGGQLLQNTANVACSFSGAAAEIYAIYAARSGSTTTFTIARAVASGFTPSATQRIVGYAKYSGTDFLWIRSSQEYDLALAHVPEGFFHAKLTAGFALTGDLQALVFDTEVHDLDNCYDTATGRFTAKRAGWHEFSAAGETYSADSNGGEVHLFMKKNGTTLARGSASSGTGGSFTFTPKIPALTVWLDVGDYVSVEMESHPSMDTTLSGEFATAFWGRWVGKKY